MSTCSGYGRSVALLPISAERTPPPALLFLLPKLDTFPNVSSLTWHVDFCDDLDTRPSENGGWWLIEGRTETARHGWLRARLLGIEPTVPGRREHCDCSTSVERADALRFAEVWGQTGDEHGEKLQSK